MLTTDQSRIALDDARHRQVALLNLLLSVENQAGNLLRLYVTLGLTSASAATATLLGTVRLPVEVGIGLLAAVAMLAAGSWYCFRAMKSALVCLPGKGAEFWQWAHHPDNEFANVVDRYLAELREKQERDRALNAYTSTALTWAKRMGTFSPVVALTVTLLAKLYNTYAPLL